MSHHSHSHSKKYILSFLVGMVIANVVIHMLPEAFEDSSIPLWLISASLFAGVILQYVLHRFLSPAKKTGNQFLVFLHVHNLTDGLTIGIAFLAEVSLGILTSVAIMIHDVIHKIIGFSFLRNGGDSIKTALLKILSTIGSILVGVGLMIIFQPNHELRVLGGAFAVGSLLFVVMLLLQEVFSKSVPLPSRYATVAKTIFLGLGGLAMVILLTLFQAYFSEHHH